MFVRDLGFAYGRRRPVLDGVGFEARGGDVVGLLGRNGSGKSTLLRLLAGLLRPSRGMIELPGFPCVVSDRTPFLEPLSARDNMLGTLALRGMAGDPARHAADTFLLSFGLIGDADRPVSEFSLGMRRRLALAEGFAAGEELILLDEPTLGLDPAGRDRLTSILRDHSGDGRTVVLATNDAAFAQATCDRVLLLHDGRVGIEGAPADLIADLAAATLLEVATTGAPPSDAAPAGLDVVDRGAESLTVSAVNASRRLPEVWAWLEAEGCRVQEVRIREPDLGDVFFAHTGEALTGRLRPPQPN